MSTTYSFCSHCESVNRVNVEKALDKKATCGKCNQSLELHGLVTSVNATGFEKIILKSDQLVVVDFWASWCGPCKMYGPTFEQVSKNFGGKATFIKVSTEQSPNIAAQYGIRGIPATVFFKNGKEVARQAGALPAEMLTNLVNTHL